MGDYLDPELTKPVKELKEKWKLLPAFLQVRLQRRARARLSRSEAHPTNELPAPTRAHARRLPFRLAGLSSSTSSPSTTS